MRVFDVGIVPTPHNWMTGGAGHNTMKGNETIGHPSVRGCQLTAGIGRGMIKGPCIDSVAE
ncbi:hypothetical protein D3C72_2576260 [compost metagenome]